jgi:long-chain fatty acid transport protein
VRADLELPRTFAIGVSHVVTPNLRLLADFTSTGWDSIQSLTVIATSGALNGQPVSNIALKFQDSWRVGAGVEYQMHPAWLLRAGLAYDHSPVQDEFRTPRLPDDDRRWLAVGARWQPNAQWAFDVGYAHLWVQSAPSSLASAGPVPGALRGRYESSSNVLAVQGAFHFGR